MAFEQKDNSFTLFNNDKKGNEKAPELKGRGLFNGEEVRIAIWKRTGKTGVEYWSGTIEKNDKPAEARKEETPVEDAVADEIPFNQDR